MIGQVRERLARVKAQVRSWSQLQQYEKCPHAFYLQRVERAWQCPAAWLPMGTAVHYAGEVWENSDRLMPADEAVEVFKDAYIADVNKLLEDTPNREWWMNSGPYSGPEDIPRRYEVGQQHVRNLVAWYDSPKALGQRPMILRVDPATNNGKDVRKAVEVPFTIDLGGVEVRGVIDWIGHVENKLRPRDLKTGANPGDIRQLKLYAIALERHLEANKTPEEIPTGDFLMTKRGTPTRDQDLRQVTELELTTSFQKMDAAVRAGDFPARPEEDKCFRCPVAYACRYKV